MLAALLPIIGTVLDKVLPDAQAAADAKLKLLEMAQRNDETLIGAAERMSTAQTTVNAAEAASGDKYTSRWRPTIGYIIGAALGFQYIVNPLLLWANAAFQWNVSPPAIVLDEHLWELITGMLGLAGWRTLDKIKGKS